MQSKGVIAFDTSGSHCAASLLLNDGLCINRFEDMKKGQAERLFPMLEELLAEACFSWRDIMAIGVGSGPGNFMGVRISVSAARGLSLGLGVKAVGINTFEAMAFGLEKPLAVVLDAGRESVYVQVIEEGGAFPPEMVGVERAMNMLGGATLVGTGAGAISALTDGCVVSTSVPLTEAIARTVAGRKGKAPRPAPFYLRDADARPSAPLYFPIIDD